MPNSKGTGKSSSGSSTQGGTHEQHVKAGQQSHKNTDSKSASASGDAKSGSKSSGTQGGTHEQHVNAGKQSHKNS
jgi:hypothetical protein